MAPTKHLEQFGFGGVVSVFTFTHHSTPFQGSRVKPRVNFVAGEDD